MQTTCTAFRIGRQAESSMALSVPVMCPLCVCICVPCLHSFLLFPNSTSIYTSTPPTMSTPPPPGPQGPIPPAEAPAAAAADAKPVVAEKPPLPAHADSKAGQYPRPKTEALPGWRGAFEYTGIPRSWLLKKPRQLLPGKKMSIFLGVVGGLTYLYYEDRRECARIRDEYVQKVKSLAEVPIGSLEEPRRVTVYAARWPEDDEADRGLRYFRKYVKVGSRWRRELTVAVPRRRCYRLYAGQCSSVWKCSSYCAQGYPAFQA